MKFNFTYLLIAILFIACNNGSEEPDTPDTPVPGTVQDPPTEDIMDPFAGFEGEQEQYYLQGVQEEKSGNYAQAGEYYRRAFDVHPNVNLSYKASKMFAKANMQEEALLMMEMTFEHGLMDFVDEPEFASLKDHPQYQDIKQRLTMELRDIQNDPQDLHFMALPNKDPDKQIIMLGFHSDIYNPIRFSERFGQFFSAREYSMALPSGSKITGRETYSWNDLDDAFLSQINTDLREKIAQNNVEGYRIICFGHDGGAVAALRFAAKYPDLVEGVITISGNSPEGVELDNSLKNKIAVFNIQGELEDKTLLEAYGNLEKQATEAGIAFKTVKYDMAHGFPENQTEAYGGGIAYILSAYK